MCCCPGDAESSLRPDHQGEWKIVRFLGPGIPGRTPLPLLMSPGEQRTSASLLGRRPQSPDATSPCLWEETREEPTDLGHMVVPDLPTKAKPNHQAKCRGWQGPAVRATQISMRLARRRQSGASTGIALRWISFPSRRSTCSLEKFMTSTTVQKLLMENSLILLPWR